MTDRHPAVTPDQYVRNLRRITPLSRGIVRDAVREMAPALASAGLLFTLVAYVGTSFFFGRSSHGW